ncbi:MAG: quinone-dependent dihydroorotate dehydrogenase [Rikenellaceae bacterium]
MYKQIIRPLLFKFQPETIHHVIISGLKAWRYFPFSKSITRGCCNYKSENLEREVFGLKFPNPVGLAAGLDKNAEVYEMFGAMGFGFVEIGTVTPKAQPGNEKPRCFRLPEDGAIINRMGFNNNGVEAAVHKLRRRNPKLIVGGNIGKNTATANECAPSDYLKLFRSMYDFVDYFVVNISCPNVVNLRELQNKDNTVEILKGLKNFRQGQSDYRPILLKISPDLSFDQVDIMIEVVRECKIDGIVATNTTTTRDGLSASSEKIEAIGRGGMSGRPLTERSREVVRYIHQKTAGKLPIIGVGGIMTPEDAKLMLEAGASLVQLYSGFIYGGPCMPKKICKVLDTPKKESTKSDK